MTEKPILLAIDTSTPSCSVAFIQGGASGQILGSLLIGGLTHSRRLLQSVESLMDSLALDWQALAGIAVSLGPGSFTGLRIGLATAKGLAMAADLPLAGCSSLRILAAGVALMPGEKICAVLDARKKEVYAGRYLFTGKELVAEGEKMVLAPQELAAQLPADILLVGDGAALYRPLFTEIAGSRVRFAPLWNNQPQAAVLGFLAAEQLRCGRILDICSLSPCYIRKSDAELNLKKG